MNCRAVTEVAGEPSFRDYITDDVYSYSFLPLVAAAAGAMGGLFGKKKKKKKKPVAAPVAAPVDRSSGLGGNQTMWIVGGIAVVGAIALLSLVRSKPAS